MIPRWRFWTYLLLIIALTFANALMRPLPASASQIHIFDGSGALIYECERTGDAVLLPTGEVQVMCGGNLLTFPATVAFMFSPVQITADTPAEVPVGRTGTTAGLVTALLSVSGPCVLSSTNVSIMDGQVTPVTKPVIAAMSGVRSGVCSISLASQWAGSLTSLTASIIDLSCHP